MDCRNFVNEVCQCEPGMELEKIFQLHESLLEKYLLIEGLPHWPINVNKREAQIILKDMSARVIEELGEGYESTTYVLEMLDKNGFNFNRWEREDYRQLLNHLQNSNEEQADAIAFFVNLLFYSNINVDDIKEYIIYKGLNKIVDNTVPKEDMSTNFVMMVGLGILQNRFEDGLIDNQHTWCVFNPLALCMVVCPFKKAWFGFRGNGIDGTVSCRACPFDGAHQVGRNRNGEHKGTEAESSFIEGKCNFSKTC